MVVGDRRPRSVYAVYLPAMRRSLLAALCAIAAGCSRGASRPRGGSPPPAEFLVASQDSTFWIATTDSSVRIRGEPITLAAYEGRFYELYSAEDDYSFPDALLVGERLVHQLVTTRRVGLAVALEVGVDGGCEIGHGCSRWSGGRSRAPATAQPCARFVAPAITCEVVVRAQVHT